MDCYVCYISGLKVWSISGIGNEEKRLTKRFRGIQESFKKLFGSFNEKMSFSEAKNRIRCCWELCIINISLIFDERNIKLNSFLSPKLFQHYREVLRLSFWVKNSRVKASNARRIIRTEIYVQFKKKNAEEKRKFLIEENSFHDFLNLRPRKSHTSARQANIFMKNSNLIKFIHRFFFWIQEQSDNANWKIIKSSRDESSRRLFDFCILRKNFFEALFTFFYN